VYDNSETVVRTSRFIRGEQESGGVFVTIETRVSWFCFSLDSSCKRIARYDGERRIRTRRRVHAERTNNLRGSAFTEFDRGRHSTIPSTSVITNRRRVTRK